MPLGETKTLILRSATGSYTRDTRLMALKVNMKIGNKPIEFVLTPGSERQIVVHFPKSRGRGSRIEYKATTYKEIISILDSPTNPVITRRNAQATLDAINTGATDVWKGMTPGEIEAAQELIVITHIAESAVPEPGQVQKIQDMIKKAEPGSKPRTKNDKLKVPEGGVGGVDKFVRVHLDDIANGKATFNEIFGDEGEFLMARQGGKGIFKEAFYHETPNSKKIDQAGKSMSLSSELNRKHLS